MSVLCSDNPHLMFCWESSIEESSDVLCRVSLTKSRTRVVGTCIYMHVWCPAGGQSIIACPLPRCFRSSFSWVRHHSAGVSRNLIQEARQGVFGVEEEGERLPTSLWAWHIETQGSLNQQGGTDHSPPLAAASNIKLMLGHSNKMTSTL